MTPGQQADAIIEDLCIRNPRDLDVEAIAEDAGMRVVYARLEGCEATLVGVADRAIATICRSSSRGREKFSIGHELGHWSMHRGKSFICRAEDFGRNFQTNMSLEKEADRFASNILMPTSLIKPMIGGLRSLSFKDLDRLRNEFETSLAATAFRITQLDNFPAVLCCYSTSGLIWSIRARMVPSRWQLKTAVDPDSFAFDLLNRGKKSGGPGKQSAETWFVNDDASHYEVIEDCWSYIGDQILVLLHLSDDNMLEASFDRDIRYNQKR